MSDGAIVPVTVLRRDEVAHAPLVKRITQDGVQDALWEDRLVKTPILPNKA